jgi:hypothetical protein
VFVNAQWNSSEVSGHASVPVGGVFQHRQRRADPRGPLRRRAVHPGAVDRDTRRAEPGVQQELHERPAERVPHQDRLRDKAGNDLDQVIHHVPHADVRKRRRVCP